MEAHHQREKHESHNPHGKHESHNTHGKHELHNSHGKHESHNQHKRLEARIPSSLRSFTQKVARPMISDRKPYVEAKTLQELHISLRSLSFSTGELPQGVQPFLEPIAPSLMQKWLDGSQPWASFDLDFFETYEDGAMLSMPYNVADHFGNLVYNYLSGTEKIDTLTPVPDFSNWRRHDNNMSDLNCLGKDPAHWRVTILQSFSQGLKMNDAEDFAKPHVICFLADNVLLMEKTVLTSELATIAVLAINTAIDPGYNHSYIPITVISGSAKSVRIVQGVLDVPHGKLELRMSEIVNFDKGIVANWDNFLKLLGWFIAKPIGKTV